MFYEIYQSCLEQTWFFFLWNPTLVPIIPQKTTAVAVYSVHRGKRTLRSVVAQPLWPEKEIFLPPTSDRYVRTRSLCIHWWQSPHKNFFFSKQPIPPATDIEADFPSDSDGLLKYLYNDVLELVVAWVNTKPAIKQYVFISVRASSVVGDEREMWASQTSLIQEIRLLDQVQTQSSYSASSYENTTAYTATLITSLSTFEWHKSSINNWAYKITGSHQTFHCKRRQKAGAFLFSFTSIVGTYYSCSFTLMTGIYSSYSFPRLFASYPRIALMCLVTSNIRKTTLH